MKLQCQTADELLNKTRGARRNRHVIDYVDHVNSYKELEGTEELTPELYEEIMEDLIYRMYEAMKKYRLDLPIPFIGGTLRIVYKPAMSFSKFLDLYSRARFKDGTKPVYDPADRLTLIYFKGYFYKHSWLSKIRKTIFGFYPSKMVIDDLLQLGKGGQGRYYSLSANQLNYKRRRKYKTYYGYKTFRYEHKRKKSLKCKKLTT